jgi:hypothetical protein
MVSYDRSTFGRAQYVEQETVLIRSDLFLRPKHIFDLKSQKEGAKRSACLHKLVEETGCGFLIEMKFFENDPACQFWQYKFGSRGRDSCFTKRTV